MDRNTILGFVFIVLILIGFSWFNRPSESEIAREKHINDSIAALQATNKQLTVSDSLKASQPDSLQLSVTDTAQINSKYGPFAPSAIGKEHLDTIENKVIKLIVSNKGGRIVSVILRNYHSYDSLPVQLFSEKDNVLGFTFATNNNRVLNTKNMYFEPIGIDTAHATVVTKPFSFIMRLHAANGAYLDYVYTINPNDYMVHWDLKNHNMASVVASNTDRLELTWDSKIKQQELGRKFESRYAGLYYKYVAADVNNLSPAGDQTKTPPNLIQWVAFKDQFFSSVLIANQSFFSTTLESKAQENLESPYLMSCKTDMFVNYNPKISSGPGFRFFFGPNKYSLLSSYDKHIPSDQKLRLTKLIPLGWGIFGWVNKYAIIPMFNFFGDFISSYGIIILLMTIVIKLILFPLTYKSYISSAKMRVLKPQIDAINAKIPSDKALERQKATMDLYKKVGVSPMSGCLPMLLQLPILIAMFDFFPSSIELRHQSFLWAKDLSSYDAIISWQTHIPFITQYFGNHISLFCLLMTIVSFVYTKLNMANQMQSSQQIPGMNMLMYFTPLLMWFWFNDYASGLSYYYFLSTLITIIQTYAIRGFVDEDKLLSQLEANKKRPTKKKSSFMERLEKMQREQMQQNAKMKKKR
ncbi:membrane protein insertase YidC [Microbacter margulisiae]|uniref:Membrane protein insertase YidC n=1 Tax=Microbacter margulisiae TaxID=1350067 RepID=A0A7W5DNH8_9PORP|nr:membrane protein insertase YidC [Microbacter margulisiae]MBB3185850.1 YidC/Oxa1 family membrane protein insertase [Microbacter margulisiae]